MKGTTRRRFLFASSGAAAGMLVVPGLAAYEENESGEETSLSGLVTGNMKPLRYREIPGFLSAAQIAPHHQAHYGGALRAFNGFEETLHERAAGRGAVDAAAFETIQRQRSSRGNSVLLHEFYFDGMAPSAAQPADGIRRAIAARFGSHDRWIEDFVASARAAAGWAMLVVHPVNGRLYNIISDEHAQGPLWMAVPLVVIDTYEHAFYIDYHEKKAEYVERFMDHIDWQEADRRLRGVHGTPA